MHRQAIGIDIGGSSIKAAIVDLSRGCLIGERRSVPSPAMSAVSEMMDAMAAALPDNAGTLTAGVTFPGVVVGGTVHTAANVAKAWIGQPLAEPAALKLKRQVVAINDADAALVEQPPKNRTPLHDSAHLMARVLSRNLLDKVGVG